MHDPLDKSTSNSPWVRVVPDDRNSGIRGNAEGLKILRDKIDEALSGDCVQMEELDCDFEQIEVREDYPNEKRGIWLRLLEVGCGIFGLLIVVLGLITLVGLAMFAYSLLTMH